jgi:hypothetical protein
MKANWLHRHEYVSYFILIAVLTGLGLLGELVLGFSTNTVLIVVIVLALLGVLYVNAPTLLGEKGSES